MVERKHLGRLAMLREHVDQLSRATVELGRALLDVLVFVGTIAVVCGGLTGLGFALDHLFGTVPRVTLVAGQSGPFALLGIASGMLLSLYAANWVSKRRKR